ncbi:NUDIX hydrolase [Bacillus thuringiensis]|uniref:NUDIX hydrolase n=1 Tax=Bacillus thuringiensis TaxID=1428 RepID=UPI00125FAF04|nr:NUDIX hydrolase [Bacillus thuringiensis]KAB5634803.1 NUDIX hydrolase [Bacillus thuringiensis]HDR5271540.1 NUDIX hydrolase [Bacillus thuringiensis]
MSKNKIDLVVSISIFKDEKVLMIKENKSPIVNKWNFPGGRIEPRENILLAALREVKEETGFDIKLNKTTGVYNFISSTNQQVILHHFTAEVVGGELCLQEKGIIDSKWIKVEEILKYDKQELREAHVIKPMVRNLLDENIFPISIYNDQLGEYNF